MNRYIVIDSEGEVDPEDCVVLRRGDVASLMTLRSYVQNLLQIIDWGRDTEGDALSFEDVQRLRCLSDDLQGLADEWSELVQKLPE